MATRTKDYYGTLGVKLSRFAGVNEDERSELSGSPQAKS